jgi:asparagine synthase (glutamine-hydrolysing)
MCGISIIVRSNDSAMSEQTLHDMVKLSKHRGPDDDGVMFWGLEGFTENAPPPSAWRVGFGHTRLAIIDLSQAGRQPMRYGPSLWLTYNGEIYNYIELRSELQSCGKNFSTQSDSEVILAAYDEWGTEAFRRFRGMWSLAILDTARKRVVFSRDRLGVKPLYVLETADGFAAASEMKQFRALQGFQFSANERAVGEYLKTGYEDPHETLFRDILPLRPGSWISVDLDSGARSEPQSFWAPNKIPCLITDPREAAVVLRDVLRDTIRLHLRSDVPVGISLSGGLDSASIATIVSQDLGRSDAHTYTCTFPGDARDERRFAEMARTRINGPASYVTPKPEEFLEELRAFVWAHDEPVGGLSVYAAYRLAKEMRATGVPVTLSGQGADEALGGYLQSYWRYLKASLEAGRYGHVMSHLGGAMLPGGNPAVWQAAPGFALRLWAKSTEEGWLETANDRGQGKVEGRLSHSLSVPVSDWRQYEMLQLFLPRLVKWEDRNSMASAVEGRYPFLDHVFVETALSMHPSTCYSRGWTKNTLRTAMKGTLPESIRLRRDKNGFEVPETRWLRTELRPTFEAWLVADRPLWARVDRSRVRRLCDNFWSGRYATTSVTAQTMFRLFSCDQWLEVFDVRW